MGLDFSPNLGVAAVEYSSCIGVGTAFKVVLIEPLFELSEVRLKFLISRTFFLKDDIVVFL